MPQIDRKTWIAVKPPVYWIKANATQWGVSERDIIIKWLNQSCGGWFYVDDTRPAEYTYMFQLDEDRVLFALWLKTEPFAEDTGELGA